jgi:tetratricopeptide (TPR) repeat protein
MRIYVRVLILFIFVLLASTTEAQQLGQSGREQQNQRVSEERLANQFYRNQEWEKAGELYLKLYQNYKSQHYFSYYLNCLIQLKEFDEAENQLKSEIKNNNRIASFQVDLGYIYLLQGDQRKARRIFDQLIKSLTPERNQIAVIANAFRSRGLYEYALQAYDFGQGSKTVDYPFYLEKASLFQFQGDYESAFENYLLQVEYQPQHLDLIKSRFQNILMMDIDNSMADLLREKLMLRAQSQSDNMLYGELLIWFSLQQKDYEIALIQAKALDRREGDRDPQILDLAHISMENRAYDVALQGFEYVANKGQNSAYYIPAYVGYLQARYLIAKQQNQYDIAIYNQLSEDIEEAFQKLGFNAELYPLLITQSSIYAYEQGKSEAAISLLEKGLMLPLNSQEEALVKLQLADIYLFINEVWEATLVYSQIEKKMKDEPVGHEARFRNATLRYYIGEFGWAAMQLDVLKAATSKLIANDAMKLSLKIQDILIEDTTGKTLKALSHAELLSFQQQDKQAKHLLDSLLLVAQNPVITAYTLITSAELATNAKEFNKADSLLELLFVTYPESYLADEAIFKSGLIQEYNLENESLAKERYQLIIDNYPASIYIAEARRRYRELRGDNIQ